VALSYYIGILDGSGDVWGVRIPDFPGVHGGGATAEEAVDDAITALREVGAIMSAEGQELPKARALTEVLADKKSAPNVRAGELAVMVPLLVDRGRPVRAISLDAGLLETIDAEAARRGLTRSAFLVSAAIDKIAHS
jgi:predicted RNase H-like HicB family nuclease